MKVLGINHLGIASKDPEKTRWFFKEVLGLPHLGDELVVEQKTNTVMFESHQTDAKPTSGRLEILENKGGDEGPIAKFLATRGGGIHHLALTVDNVEAAIAHMQKHEIQMIDTVPRGGAHNTRIAFVHPRATGGILIELVQEA